MRKELGPISPPPAFTDESEPRLVEDPNSISILRREVYMLSTMVEGVGLAVQTPENELVDNSWMAENIRIDESRKRALVVIAQTGKAHSEIYREQIRRDPTIPIPSEIDHGQLAVARILIADMGAVIAIAKRFIPSGIPMEDLVQVGFQAYQESIYRFDQSHDEVVLTYCLNWVKWQLARYVESVGGEIRLPIHVHSKLRTMRRAIRSLPENDPSPEQIANESQIPVRLVRQLLDLPRTISWEAWNAQRDTKVQKSIRDTTLEGDVDAFVQEVIEEEKKVVLINSLLDVLNPREKEIIMSMFGMNEEEMEYQQTAIGNRLGVTKERIRQLKNKALDKMRRAAEKRGLLM